MNRSFTLLLAGALVLAFQPAFAASHSDAPLISQDPMADNTDVYAWVSNVGGEDKLVLISNAIPMMEPSSGPNFYRFGDDVQYEIHITNPTTGASVLRYEFRFSDVNPTTTPGLQDPDSLLNYGVVGDFFPTPVTSIAGSARNFTQTYTITRTDGTGTTIIGQDLPTAVPNVGVNTTFLYNTSAGVPITGATTDAELDPLTSQAIQTLATGERAFAGPRDDGFYADLGAVFDFLDVRMFDNDGDFSDGLGQDGGGRDAFAGFNTMAIAIEIPVEDLPQFDYAAPITGASSSGVGVYAATRRQRIQLRMGFADAVNFGPFVQGSRMGNPLFNKALVLLRGKDFYNRTFPTGDFVSSLLTSAAMNPELARQLSVLHPPFAAIQKTGRSDVVSIYIPDVLKVDLTTGNVPLPGQSGFNRLGAFGGDMTGTQSSGWPNGRRIGDDVVDTLLSVLNNGTTYPSDLGTVVPIGDNVSSNDLVYNQVFPSTLR